MDKLKYAKRPHLGRAGRRKTVESIKINMLNILTRLYAGVPSLLADLSSSLGDDFRTGRAL